MASIPIVNTMDKRKGIAAAIVVMLLLLIYLLLATIPMADPPPKDDVLSVETQIPKEFILENLKVEGGSNAGTPSDDPISPPAPQTQKILTKKENPDTKTETGQANSTTASNSQNETSNQQVSNDPFASGGSTSGTGNGSTFGSSSGTGTGGAGSGSGIKRVRLNDPVFDHLESNEYATIVIVCTIDAEGNIVSASCNKSATTTTNQILINRVLYEVQKQVKFNKDPGAPLAKVSIPVKITPK